MNMAFLKFNKSELVNLSYSLKREILGASKTGAYCNSTIVTCNTRRYHALLAVTLDRFGGDRYVLLSDTDESLIIDGKQFNLGIHCYGDIYEPRGHKYVVDFDAVPIPQITYQVGSIKLRKSIMLAQDRDQVMIKYDLLESASPIILHVKPFLAFRNSHSLTQKNDMARTSGVAIEGGAAYSMYDNFPALNMQMNGKPHFEESPYWNMQVTYSDEYRRGFDCREDLFVPGTFEVKLAEGKSVIFSASLTEENTKELQGRFKDALKKKWMAEDYHDQLAICADRLITNHNNRKKINSGYTWMGTGILRDSLQSISGLVLYGQKSPEEFEEILDNLIEDNQERLFRKTTQIEAPLRLANVLQHYIAYGADRKRIWKKYGETVKNILESYLPGHREEVAMHPNGLLWAQKDGVALSWMNAYINGRAVTERAGYQVETNALWYNAICFALEMESEFGKKKNEFITRWSDIRQMVLDNYQNTFWNESAGYLADYVDNNGQHLEVRPNMLYALWVDNSPIDEELFQSILRVADNELVTSRGIRTLSPRDAAYKGVYEGSQIDRDLAYHNGSTRIFMLDVYIAACFKVRGESFLSKAKWLCEGFYEDLNKHGVGAFSELYDGDPPHEPHGAISSARSTAALLNIEHSIKQFEEGRK